MSHLLASIPFISPVFQVLLNAIGWLMAWLFDVINNYGVAIIVLTILIRIVILPFGIKQIKSMQSMQALQPKIKEIQKKYKGNKQKQQEETMKLYSQYGVNPLGGCIPLLLTFPFLIAMYAVIRAPQLVPATVGGVPVYEVHNSHLPIDSALFKNVITQGGTQFLGLDLQCSAAQAGTQAPNKDNKGQPLPPGTSIVGDHGQPLPFTAVTSKTLDCGSGGSTKIPYFLFLAAMVGTTFYQQRQMQKVSPPGSQSQQQQMIMMAMPVFFGFIGFQFPAGLLIYWTTANLLQIGQQYTLLKLGHIGPEALERRAAAPAKEPKKPGYFGNLMSKAEEERKKREAELKGGARPKGSGSKGSSSSKGTGGSSKGGSGRSGSGASPKKKPSTGGGQPGSGKPTPKKKPNSGGSSGQTK